MATKPPTGRRSIQLDRSYSMARGSEPMMREAVLTAFAVTAHPHSGFAHTCAVNRLVNSREETGLPVGDSFLIHAEYRP